MTKISRPPVSLPRAPEKYDQREQNEFRRLVAQFLADPVEDLIRPSLDIVVTPSATEYVIVVTWTGTMTYTIDGAGPFDASTSPQTFTVARNTAPGPAIVYQFTVSQNQQSAVDTVTVLPIPATGEPVIILDDPQTADDATDEYAYSWTTANMPGGETFSVEYVIDDTAFSVLGHLTGTVDPATSGGVIASPTDIGASPSYDYIVRAFLAGDQIAYARKTGTFQT